MSTASWSIQSSKRKQSTATPTPRKRARISDDVERRNSTRAKRKAQTTLTQIQWVNSPNTSFQGDGDLEEIGPHNVHPKRTNGSGSKRTRVKKRDSTLTQMDWLGGLQTHDGGIEDYSESLPKNLGFGADPIPQLDGESAGRIPTKQEKSSIRHPRSSSPSSVEHETQDFIPTQMPQILQGKDLLKAKVRRRSSRIASKVNESPRVNQGGNTDLTQTSDKSQRPTPERSKQVAFNVVDRRSQEVEETPTHPKFQPETPRRQRVIPSSQTPESIHRTTKRIKPNVHWSPSKPSVRRPLGEISTNVPSRTYSQGLEASKSVLKHNSPSPPRRKICVLKVPVHALLSEPQNDESAQLERTPPRKKICALKIPRKALLPRPKFVDDSQRDTFSLQGSSDPRDSKQPSPVKNVLQSVEEEAIAEEPVEVPPTSEREASSESDLPSSPPVLEDSVPELTDLIPPRRPAIDFTPIQIPNKLQYHQANGEDLVMVYDFGRSDSQKNATTISGANDIPQQDGVGDEEDLMLLDHEVVDVQPESFLPLPVGDTNKHMSDEHDDFGSPNVNDTQFNTDLQQRTSSPHFENGSQTKQNQLSLKEKLNPVTPSKSRSSVNSIQHAIDEGEEVETETEIDTPIPIPRLVERMTSSVHSPVPEIDRMEVEIPTQLLPALNTTNTTTTAKVPLNDTLHSSSSSPRLPSVRSTMNRIVHPASLPHPSQISTQDPTQNSFPSSMPPPTQHWKENDPITIKDSSSVRLSQIPRYQTQSQAYNILLANNSIDDIDDLDLDPASLTPYAKQSARKLFHLQRNETGSSLRSIHPHSDGSSSRSSHANRSSSPLRKDQPVNTLGNDKRGKKVNTQMGGMDKSTKEKPDQTVHDSDEYSSISSPEPPPLKGKYDPLPGFDNETQSNFTQNGHITAAYVHRQRETGAWPDWFVPEPFQLADGKRPAKQSSSKKRKRT